MVTIMKMKILNNSPALARYESPTSRASTILQNRPILTGSVNIRKMKEEDGIEWEILDEQ